MSDTLFGAGRRHQGPAERALARQLRAWSRVGWLAGDDHAAVRAALAHAARAADLADLDAREGGSRYTASSCANTLHSMLLSVSPPEREAADDDGDLAALIELGGAARRHGDTSR